MNIFYSKRSGGISYHGHLILLLIAFIATLPPGCSDSNEISLRKFPYPYVAALAICSDIDQTGSFEEFIAIQRFLNTEMNTEFGPGLGLEIGNSFWFYNDCYDLPGCQSGTAEVMEEGISIFNGTSDSLNDFAPEIIKMIKAGYVDCLHSYGHFGREGFNRDLAGRAIDFMKADSFEVDVYINHGAVGTNFQNVGDASWNKGDNPESDNYHTDITVPGGIKFIWRGQLTHCIGQDGDVSVLNLLKRIYEYYQDYRNPEQDFPNDNSLVHPYRLDDGQMVFEFERYINPWGKYPAATEENFPMQLGPSQVDDLIENQGYMIFYTHFGRNRGIPYLSEPTLDALRYIKEMHDQDSLMVATTSRLLNYYVHHKYLFWHTEWRADTSYIIIDSIANEVEGCFVPDASQLAGMTFYIPENNHIQLFSGDVQLDIQYNKADETGRRSISVPWPKLSPPLDIYGADRRDSTGGVH